jgi:hypothetical protein
VIPNFSPWVAAKLSPVRSIYEVEEELRQAYANAGEQSYSELNEYARSLPRDRENWTDEQNARFQELLRIAWPDYLSKRVESVVNTRQAFMNELQHQAEVSRWLSLISPSASFALLVSDVASTGMESERNFRRSAFRYKRDYIQFVVKELARGNDDVTRHIDETAVPPFTYKELRLEQVFAGHLPSLLALLIYAVLLLICPQIAFNRMQV